MTIDGSALLPHCEYFSSFFSSSVLLYIYSRFVCRLAYLFCPPGVNIPFHAPPTLTTVIPISHLGN
jgi:hypothetical protein